MRPTLRELRAKTRGERRDMFIPIKDCKIELRTAEGASDGDPAVLRFYGLAAVFDQEADIGGWFTETVKRGAARKALDENQDTVFNWDHDSRWPLGRVSAGNVNLREVPEGFEVTSDIPLALSYAQDLKVLLEHRIIKGMSVGFTVLSDEWTERTIDGVYSVHRDILEWDQILDVCVTANPAYGGTTAESRSLDIDGETSAALATLALEGIAQASAGETEPTTPEAAPPELRSDATAGDETDDEVDDTTAAMGEANRLSASRRRRIALLEATAPSAHPAA